MRYLFWNTNKKNVNTYLIKLIHEYDPSIIALAEYNGNTDLLINEIKKSLNKDFIEIQQFACRVRILVKAKLESSVQHCDDHTNYTIKIIPYNSYQETHIVAFLHLPSKMFENEEKNRYLLEQITLKINELDDNEQRKVVIFGDFNVNPYEKPMTNLTGCNAVPSRNIAMKITKNQKGDKRKFFYY